MTPVSSSTSTTSALAGPPASPDPDALAAASLAHQNRVTHSARLEPDQRSRRARSPGVNAAASKLGRAIGDRFDVDAHAGRRIERGQGDGDSVGMGDRDGRQRARRGFAHPGQPGPAVFVGDDRQIGWINRGLAGVVPEPPGGLLGRDPAPKPLRPPLLGPARCQVGRALVGPELRVFQHVAPDGPAHVGRGFEPDRFGPGQRTMRRIRRAAAPRRPG